MNVDACTSLPITTTMSRLDLRIGVSLPGPLRRAGLPRPGPAASGTGRGGASAAALTGVQGGPMRRSNFNKMSAWPHAVRAIGAEGLHFHDLRHTGNHLAAKSGAGLRDLMARMGHDSERAAMIYQHEAQGADQAITKAIDAHIEAQQHADGDDDDGTARVLVPAG
jgi:integrase